MPLVSIITVSFNAAGDIERTLRSVDNQTFTDYEHLIVDGASTDGTLASIRAAGDNPRRWVISEPDEGIYDAMNKGLQAARGEYLLFLNAGDEFHDTGTLERLVAPALNYTKVKPGIIYGQTMLIDKDGKIIGPRHLRAPENLTLASFADGMVVCHQAFMVRKTIAEPYDRHFRFSADYDWCIRCLQHSKLNVYVGPDPVTLYLKEGVTTANRRESLLERFHIMCRYYGRRRTVLRHIGFIFRKLRAKPGTERNV